MSDKLLPSSQFDRTLSRLLGLPNGAHTQPHVVQDVDFYGNSTQYIVQTVKTEEGATVFLRTVNADGAKEMILPPKVLALIDRQRDTTVTQVRRRIGKRLAEERRARGEAPAFMRGKKGGRK